MDVATLNEKFGIHGVLSFEKTASGLVAAHVTTPAAEATIYTQGAHLTHWKPTGQAPAIFLSAKSDMAPGKPIRGGVPVVFPWFSQRHDGKTGPMHGFARTTVWELAAAMMSGADLHLMWTLLPDEVSRGLGFDHFKVVYRMVIGKSLTLEMTVANDSGNGGGVSKEEMTKIGAPLVFEQLPPPVPSWNGFGDARRPADNPVRKVAPGTPAVPKGGFRLGMNFGRTTT